MKIIYGLNNLKRQKLPSVVCVGIFDGVHIGHQKVIKRLVKEAKKGTGYFLKANQSSSKSSLSPFQAALVTFQPHPVKFLNNRTTVPMLTALKHRLQLLEDLGVELCLIAHFTKSLARLSAAEFIQKILLCRLNMKVLVVGERFSFGRERLHRREELSKIAEALGFKLTVVRQKKYRSHIISSSLIRALIEKGKLKSAARLLTRPVSILGTVIRGKQRGRIIGFKTANINPHHEAIPPSGVYAVYCRLEGETYKSILNIGTRPTFGEREPTIEVHLFGFNGRLYGKDIEVIFKKRLRPERRFKNKDHLREQIIRDAAVAESIL